jgi:serine/threonine-protein kinase RsbW
VRDVEIRTSADAEQVGLLRSFAVDVAMRMDFDLDVLEDLRVLVDEACSLLVRLSRPDSMLICRLEPGAEGLWMHLLVEADQPTPPSADPLGWQIIRALADSAQEQLTTAETGYRVSLELLAGHSGTDRGE